MTDTTESIESLIAQSVQLMRRFGVQLANGETPEEQRDAEAIVTAFYDLQEALENEEPEAELVRIAKQSYPVLRDKLPANAPVVQAALILLKAVAEPEAATAQVAAA